MNWSGLANVVQLDSPGRFFVAHELKMLMAYLLMNYDIKPLGERPPSTWVAMTVIPAVGAKIEIRRRASTTNGSK